MKTKLVIVSVKHSRGRAQAVVRAKVHENGSCIVSEEVMEKLFKMANITIGDTFTM